MDPFSALPTGLVEWALIPLLIFLARVCDVTIGTMRIIFLSKGRRNLAPLLGFVEVLIWLAAISQVMKNLNNVACYLAWAGGFATGNFIGLWLEERLALGTQIIRVITPTPAEELALRLRGYGFGVTKLEAQGAHGPVQVLLTIFRRRDLTRVLEAVHQLNPKAFYTIEDVRSVSDAVYSPVAERKSDLFGIFASSRKAK